MNGELILAKVKIELINQIEETEDGSARKEALIDAMLTIAEQEASTVISDFERFGKAISLPFEADDETEDDVAEAMEENETEAPSDGLYTGDLVFRGGKGYWLDNELTAGKVYRIENGRFKYSIPTESAVRTLDELLELGFEEVEEEV